jgi:diguanylate cyclase (GGDEF)-like protein/PAS domain S-box-containing protein
VDWGLHGFLLPSSRELQKQSGATGEQVTLIKEKGDAEFCIVLPKTWKNDGTLDVLQEVLDGVSDGVYFVDRDRRIHLWNRGAEEISGFRAKEVVGRCCPDNILQHVDDEGTHLGVGDCPLTAAMSTGKYHEAEIYLHHGRGFRKPILVKVKPVYDADKNLVGAVETFCDNTRVRSAEAEIERLKSYSLFDPVAGVGNKQFIEGQLQSALSPEGSRRVPLAVLHIRLSGLEEIGDRHGAEIGNETIKVMGQTLTGALRSGDSLGHVSEYEFVALLLNARENDAKAVGNRFINLISESSLRFAKFDLRVGVCVSGTCVRPSDTVDSILRRVARIQNSSEYDGASGMVMD